MKPPFRVRKHDGRWYILRRTAPGVWLWGDDYATQAEAVGDVYRRWPWWP